MTFFLNHRTFLKFHRRFADITDACSGQVLKPNKIKTTKEKHKKSSSYSCDVIQDFDLTCKATLTPSF